MCVCEVVVCQRVVVDDYCGCCECFEFYEMVEFIDGVLVVALFFGEVDVECGDFLCDDFVEDFFELVVVAVGQVGW